MGKDITSSHDEFFKNIMGRVENTRTYIAHYLPADITSRMNLDTLEVDIEGYVDDDLKSYFSTDIHDAAEIHFSTGAASQTAGNHVSPEPSE